MTNLHSKPARPISNAFTSNQCSCQPPLIPFCKVTVKERNEKSEFIHLKLSLNPTALPSVDEVPINGPIPRKADWLNIDKESLSDWLSYQVYDFLTDNNDADNADASTNAGEEDNTPPVIKFSKDKISREIRIFDGGNVEDYVDLKLSFENVHAKGSLNCGVHCDTVKFLYIRQ